MADNNNDNKNNEAQKYNLSESGWAFLMICFGVITYIILTMPNIGIVGGFIKLFILSLFSSLSYLISFFLVIAGGYKLIFKPNFTLDSIDRVDAAVFVGMIMFIYSATNVTQLQLTSSITFANVKTVIADAQEFKGLGIVCYVVTIFVYKLIGRTGIIVAVIMGLIYLVIKHNKDDVMYILEEIRAFISRIKKLSEDKYEEVETGNQEVEIVDNSSALYEELENIESIEEIKKDDIILDEVKESSEFEKETNKLEQKEEIKEDIDFQDVLKKNQVMDLPNDYNNQKNDENNLEYNLFKQNSNIQDEHFDYEICDIDSLTDVSNELDINCDFISDETSKEDELNLDDKPKLNVNRRIIKYVNSPKNNKNFTNIYKKPTISLLNEYERLPVEEKEEKEKKAKLLEQTLASFGVEANVGNIAVGPTITRYELKPKSGTKVSKITNLTEDLALALAAKAIRIEAPIPGKSFIGIEVPNDVPQMVSFKEVIRTCIIEKNKYKIAFAMGKDISGNVILSDITKMPHTLIAGSTGSGKSVCINTIICSILYNYSPQEVKLILVDPKVVELSIYNKMPHLIIPVVTDMKKAPQALNWAVNEMEKRYALFAQSKSKDIDSYNQKFDEKLPRIVIIIDELADLMMVSPKEIEESICRLAQKARACGIHLIVATQRPSVDVITGLIKANVPSRIAFAVSSQTDSRTIIDSGGAEKLLGKGDMLYSPIGMSKPIRIQGAFLTEEEVEKITQYIEENNQEEDIEKRQEEVSKEIEELSILNDAMEDELYEKVVEFAQENEEISVSLVQRQFRIGYNRASRIVDDMEKNGVVSKSDGSKLRKVIKGD